VPLFAAIFEDHLDRKAVRDAAMAAHLAWLDRHRKQVLMAGALRPEPDGTATGGLWIIEAASRAEAERICTEDPFFTSGLRKSFRLESWSRGFPEQPVTI
jgi:uncharacterized protein YciI